MPVMVGSRAEDQMQEMTDSFGMYVQHGSEERYLEYKGAMSWESDVTKEKIAKAIVAFSNIAGGGVIVVGMREFRKGVWEPVGVTNDQLDSFKQDDVAQFVNDRFVPAAQFSIYPIVVDELWFVLIQVQEFDRIPLICRSPFTRKGKVVLRPSAVYYRSKRKIESAEIGTEEDMRDLTELAIAKGVSREVQRLRGLGFVPPPVSGEQIDDKKFVDERQGL